LVAVVTDALAVPVAEALFVCVAAPALVPAPVPAPAAFAGALTVVALVGSDVVPDVVPDAHAARTAALRPAEANPSQNRAARVLPAAARGLPAAACRPSGASDVEFVAEAESV
jgi:hypothetical protein